MSFLHIFKKKQEKKSATKTEKHMNGENVVKKEYKCNENFIDFEKENKDLIIKEILNVAIYHDKFEELKARAKIAAYNIGDENIRLLPEYLKIEINKPNELKEKYESNNQWEMVVENSVLMIIFSYKEKGVQILSEIAYGKTKVKLKAINLLIKLCNMDVCKDEIIDELISNINKFSNEEKIIIFGFASQLKENNKIIALIQYFYKEFLKDEDVENAYETLISLINVAQNHTSGHLNFLKYIAMDNEKIELKKVISISDNEKEFINIENLDEFIKIRAALTYYNINKEDLEINNKLVYLSENFYNDKVRSEIKRVIEAN